MCHKPTQLLLGGTQFWNKNRIISDIYAVDCSRTRAIKTIWVWSLPEHVWKTNNSMKNSHRWKPDPNNIGMAAVTLPGSVTLHRIDSQNFYPPTEMPWRNFCMVMNMANQSLVGGIPTPLKNMSSSVESVGMIIPNVWKNKKCSKPPTRINLGDQTTFPVK